MRSSRFAAFVGLAFCMMFAGASHAKDTKEREQTYRRSTAAGEEVRVVTYVQHKEDCSPKESPSVKFTSKPAHGSVSLRPGKIIAGPSRLGSNDCTGRELPGVSIWYLPEKGYVGTDQFTFDAFFSNGVTHDTGVIRIKAPD